MKKIILFGLAAAFFFSSTFAINRWLNVQQGGHWFWTACLRYVYVFIFLSLLTILSFGKRIFIETMKCFFSYWYFWVIAGGVGFGLFYLSLCYAASYSSGWVLATTWQLTILMTPIVIIVLGNRVSLRGIMYLLIMFIGIVLVNIDEFTVFSSINLKSILPITFAAFCYPFGNTLCKYACEGRYPKIPVSEFSISKNVISQILLMTLGAIPVLVIVGFIVSPPNPTTSQLFSTAFIALSTGVIATSFLYKARQLSQNNTLALAAADGTQAVEAPLALFWEWLIFSGLLPSMVGFSGLSLVILGIILFYRSKVNLKSNNL